MNDLRNIVILMRPFHWIKNAFVFTGFIFAHKFHDVQLLLAVIQTAIAFCIVSSSVYVFNDLLDRKKDARHPKKKNRPLAAGWVSPAFGMGLSLTLFIIGMVLSYLVSKEVFLITFSYVLLNIAYTLRLKDVVLVDVFCISAGFMLRIFAGTLGVGIPPSKWLLLCGMMITLLLGFAKRRVEVSLINDNKIQQRRVLRNYSPLILDEFIGICTTGVILSYSLYTMSPDTIAIHHTDNLIYTVPFVIYALFRYIFLLIHFNIGEDPSNELLRDKHIFISVLGWAIMTFSLISGSG